MRYGRSAGRRWGVGCLLTVMLGAIVAVAPPAGRALGVLSLRADPRMGFGIRFVEHARAINNRMPARIVSRIADALNDIGRPIRGSLVMALGVAYKADVDDVRVAVHRRHRAAAASRRDVLLPRPLRRVGTARWRGRVSQPLSPEVLETQDLVAILTAHETVNYAEVVASAQLVLDARGVTRQLVDAPNVIRL